MALNYNLLVVLGATAGGKTAVAAHWASRHGGEVISADSRQVYRGMNIGTGKDYADYVVNGSAVPYHCIDIAEAGTHYNVYAYQQDFLAAYADILARGRPAVLCGGSGMYIEAAIYGYRLLLVPRNEALRASLEEKTMAELTGVLASLKTMHNHTDSTTRRRLLRAIEIAEFQSNTTEAFPEYPEIRPLIIGIESDRETRRKRITERLCQRLEAGMLNEVQLLIDGGLTPAQIEYYGLEYKYLTKHLTHGLSYSEMFTQLNTAIHQFAKRQMTWFRRMERNGALIHWLSVDLPMEEKLRMMDEWWFATQQAAN